MATHEACSAARVSAVDRFGAASVGVQRNGGSTLRLQKLKRLRGSRKGVALEKRRAQWWGAMACGKDGEQDPRIGGIAASIRVVPDFPKKGIMFQDITTLLLDPKAFKNTVDLFVERYIGKDVSVVAALFVEVAVLMQTLVPVLMQTGETIATVGWGLYILFLCWLCFTFTVWIWLQSIVCTVQVSAGFCLVNWIEARGFIFGPPIALAIGAKFVPLRKPRKLPGEVISEKYVLEYGTDCLEMHVGAVQSGDRALVVDDLIATGGTLCAAMNLLERAGAEVIECACVIELPELKFMIIEFAA
ncbi:adenine phosphoribosyltransferase [Musa troglodytarum]|uniref:adenine phosphoribosyltransferase n=1 Tax=Musa troglodytarum TaxID=320322 RepID=A0A9E7GZC1_9LILI|nr:adenine phosphoribosyltransferase [Musa troglodytarum]